MRKITYWLSLILIFVIPWENILVFPGLGTIGRVVGLLTGCFWIYTVIKSRKIRKLHSFHWLFFLFFLWNTISIFWTIDTHLTRERILTNFQLVVLVLIIWDIYTDQEHVKCGLQAYVLGAWVASGLIIYNFVLNINVNASNRYTIIGFNENIIAFLISLGIPLAWHLAISDLSKQKPKFLRCVNYLYPFLALFAIVLTGTRTGLLASIPALIYVIVSLFTSKNLEFGFDYFIGLGGLLLLIVIIVDLPLLERVISIRELISDMDFEGRGKIWRNGIKLFWEHPIIGSGGNTFTILSANNREAHNVFLSQLVEVGIIGLALISALCLLTLYAVFHQPKKELSILWLLVFLAWFINANATSLEYRKGTWLFFGLIIASSQLSKTGKKSEADNVGEVITIRLSQDPTSPNVQEGPNSSAAG